MSQTDYSPELMDACAACTADELMRRVRISELGTMAAKYANPAKFNIRYKKPDGYKATRLAHQAAHDARQLFPELFIWEEQRRGQLNLGDVA